MCTPIKRRVSKEQIALEVVNELKQNKMSSMFDYKYRSTIEGFIQSSRYYHGYICEASNEEIYDQVTEVLKQLDTEGKVGVA